MVAIIALIVALAGFIELNIYLLRKRNRPRSSYPWRQKIAEIKKIQDESERISKRSDFRMIELDAQIAETVRVVNELTEAQKKKNPLPEGRGFD